MSIGRIEIVNGVKKNVRYATFGGGEDIIKLPTGTPLGDVINLRLGEDYDRLLLMWNDPNDIVYNGEKIVEWSGTKVVRKEGGYPLHPDDGELVIDSTTRNEYESTALQDVGLSHDKEYYYTLFPYSKTGVVTLSDFNRIFGKLLEHYLIGEVTNFSLGTYYWDTLNIVYDDPSDLVVDGIVRSSWLKTVLVMNTNHYPENETDGIVVAEKQGSRGRNYVYITSYLPSLPSGNILYDYNLEYMQEYYFMVFVYTTDGKIRKCELNKAKVLVDKVRLRFVPTQVGSYGFSGYDFDATLLNRAPNYYTHSLASGRTYESNFTYNSDGGGEPYVIVVNVGTYYMSATLSVTINGEAVLSDENIANNTGDTINGVLKEYDRYFVYERNTVPGVNTINVKYKVNSLSSVSAVRSRGCFVNFYRNLEQVIFN